MDAARQIRSTHPFSLILALLVLMCLAGVHQAFASGPVGKILGTVTDKSGASVAGAKVSAINQSTAETRVAQTDDAGNFTFVVLPVGNYTVKVEKEGFQTSEQKNIVLQVDQSVSILPVLEVGLVTQTVTVEAAAAQINVTDATISHVVDQQRVVDLPLNGRDALGLQFTMPGVTYDTNNVAHGQGQHEGVVVNGNRPGSNYYLLDGVDMTDSYLSVAPTFPAPDALQEFDIQTSDFNAQYGRSSGGLINVATKSGGNQWHGDLFEFFRNDKLNAHAYFDTPGSPVGHYRLNQFGGTIGGPIQHNKTFIFGYFQESRQRRSTTATIPTVLTPSERPDTSSDGSANFSDICPGSTCPIDPRTGVAFPNNTVPANRIDPTALNFVKAVLPLPNNGRGFVYQAPNSANLDDNNQPQFVVRLDHTFSASDTAFVRYFFNQDRGSGILGFPAATHVKDFRNQAVAIEWTHTFSPTLLNSATLGFNRLSHYRAPTKSIGWQLYGGPAGQGNPSFPSELYASVNGSITTAGDGSFGQNRQTSQISDFITLVKGKHTLNVGGDFRKEAVNRFEDFFSDPDFTFSGQYSNNALADLLLGLPNYFELDNEIHSNLRHKSVDLFVTDNIKVKSNLTVDAGLRWEPFLPPVDNLNNQMCWDPSFTKKSALFPTAPPGITFPGDSGCPRGLVPNRLKNFAPRLGLNWDPFKTGKTSVRAGFGIFWDQARLIGYNRFSTAQPFDTSVQIQSPGSHANFAPDLTGNSVFTNTGTPYPYPFTIPTTAAQRAAFSPLFGGNWPTNSLEVGLPPNFNEGYVQEWNFTIQQQLANDYSLTASYVGNRGNHLWFSRNYNYAIYNPAETVQQNQNTFTARQRLSSITCGGPTANCYGSFEEEANAGWSTYNAVQVSLNKKFHHGLSFLASYVYGKYLDIVSYGAEGGNGPRDPANFALSYGPSDNDVRHRVAASYIWQIPQMQGLHGAASGILNHWELQGITIAQTGTPFTILSNTDTSLTGIGSDTAAPLSGVAPNVGHSFYSGNSLFFLNPSAYQNAPFGTFGVLGRNSFYGPKYVNFDFSLFKEFPISERMGKIQFRSEFFNLFNHPNFFNPNNTVGSALGQITSAHDPRFVQFAVKWLF